MTTSLEQLTTLFSCTRPEPRPQPSPSTLTLEPYPRLSAHTLSPHPQPTPSTLTSTLTLNHLKLTLHIPDLNPLVPRIPDLNPLVPRIVTSTLLSLASSPSLRLTLRLCLQSHPASTSRGWPASDGGTPDYVAPEILRGEVGRTFEARIGRQLALLASPLLPPLLTEAWLLKPAPLTEPCPLTEACPP